MIARLLRLLLIGQLVAVGLVAAALLSTGVVASVALALLLALVIALAVRLLITINNFRLSRHFGSPTPPAHRLGLWQAMGLVLREYASTMWHSSWSMARHKDGERRQDATKPGVLLVHGYACNGGYWGALTARLAARGHAFVTVDLEPVGASIDQYAERIEVALAAMGPGQHVVVAHSMGGLVMRAYLRRYGAQRVLRVITLGTPHQGTHLANFGPGINALQMRYHSDWLRELDAAETPATRSLFLSIYSHHDNIIAPQNSSVLTGADHLELSGIGHVALGSHPRVLTAILKEINRVGIRGDSILD